MEAEFPEDRLSQALAENARLREQADAMQGERTRLAAELESALAATRFAREELHDFVYAASHDLKAPLRTITSYTQLLQRQCAGQEGVEEYVQFIDEGVRIITNLIDQLLHLSRAGSSLKVSNVNLGIPIQTALFKLSRDIKDTGTQVSVATRLPEVPVDEAQFAQVLESLIDNAIKYRGSEPCRIDISGEEGDEGFLIAVRDNGPGIEEKFHKQVFLPFKRLHGNAIPGSGLGLALSRKIVEAHGGTIRLESDGISGSVFKILLPY